MKLKKWVEIKPIGYVGIALGLSGTLVPQLLNITNGLVLLISCIISMVGFYLALYKGRKEHGL